MANYFKINKYTIIAQIYFFFNALLLPKGLLYTTILSPIFYFNLIRKKRSTYWKQFFTFLVFFDVVHLFYGVDTKTFLISNSIFIAIYFCVVSFYHFVNEYQYISKLFKQIVVLNFILFLVAIPFLFMDLDHQAWFWWVNKLTKGVTDFPRLKLLTYEASYYSLLLVPILYYYIFKFLFKQFDKNKYLNLAIVLIPFIVSMSFGVIGASLITGILLCFGFRKNLVRYRKPLIFSSSILSICLIVFFIAIFYFPQSPITIRFFNILNGTDTSANGRILDSYDLAFKVAQLKNIFFGVGLGQVKIQLPELIKLYYNYWGNLARYDIPNTMGETLAIFGFAGVVVRLVLQWYLFFKTKVYQNYYRLSLFTFIFVYQFTGSFITNIAEYVIWIFAFSQVFPQFNVVKKIT